MGLSIHYWLRTEAGTASEVRQQIEQLQQAACGLPFEEVGEVIELASDEIDVQPGDDPIRSWLVTQAGRWLALGDGLHPRYAPASDRVFDLPRSGL